MQIERDLLSKLFKLDFKVFHFWDSLSFIFTIFKFELRFWVKPNPDSRGKSLVTAAELESSNIFQDSVIFFRPCRSMAAILPKRANHRLIYPDIGTGIPLNNDRPVLFIDIKIPSHETDIGIHPMGFNA